MNIKKISKRYYKPLKEIYIILFIIIFFISYLSIFYKSKFNPTKRVCLCLIAKNENKYSFSLFIYHLFLINLFYP